MRSIRDIHFSWRHLLVIATASVLASTIILVGAGGKSQLELAALAALRHPPARAVTEPSGSSSHQPSSPGGNGGSNPSPGHSSTPTTSTPSTTATTPAVTTTTTTKTTKKRSKTTKAKHAVKLPTVKHVFEITLSTPSYKAAFEDKKNFPYLEKLAKQGTELSGFRSLGSGSELADYLAMTSGQAPNAKTAKGCTTLTNFSSKAKLNKVGDISGAGCIYPEAVTTVASQAEYEAQTWGAYIQDQSSECAHVNPGTAQNVVIPNTESGYDSLHNPFPYFDGLLLDDCSSQDLDLSKLPAALKSPSTIPNFVYVAPNACADGDPQMQPGGTSTTTTTTPTTTSTTTTTTPTPTQVNNEICPAGEVSGMAAENAFLKSWVPRILSSKAYKDHGVLVIAFAGSGSKKVKGGFRTGALVISAHTKHGLKISRAYSPYSLLRSVSQMLKYPTEAHASSGPSFAKLVLSK